MFPLSEFIFDSVSKKLSSLSVCYKGSLSSKKEFIKNKHRRLTVLTTCGCIVLQHITLAEFENSKVVCVV